MANFYRKKHPFSECFYFQSQTNNTSALYQSVMFENPYILGSSINQAYHKSSNIFFVYLYKPHQPIINFHIYCIFRKIPIVIPKINIHIFLKHIHFISFHIYIYTECKNLYYIFVDSKYYKLWQKRNSNKSHFPIFLLRRLI